MADNFHRATRPPRRMAVVTPSDSVNITLEGQERRARALYLGVLAGRLLKGLAAEAIEEIAQKVTRRNEDDPNG